MVDNLVAVDNAIDEILECQDKIQELQEVFDKKVEILKQQLQSSINELNAKITYNTTFIESQDLNWKETKTQKTFKSLSGKIKHKFPVTDIALDKELDLAKIPKEFIVTETKQKVDWKNYKESLKQRDLIFTDEGECVDVDTGEVIPNIVEKFTPGKITVER